MSRVYRLNLGEFYYIGSTDTSLPRRLAGHKSQSKKTPEVKLYIKAVEIGWENVEIKLVEECGMDEAYQREDAHINLTDPLCLNTYRAHLSAEDKRVKKNLLNKEFRLRKREANPLPPPLTDEERRIHLCEATARWKVRNPERVKESNKKAWANRQPETPEEMEERRKYQREYMRRRRNPESY